MKRKQQNTRFSRLAAKADSQQPAFSMPQNPTSGQLDPKSNPGGKLRQESEQPRPSERLRHEDDAPPPAGEAGADPAEKKSERDNKRFEKSKLKADKTGVKLDAAQEKLAAQKPPKKPGPLKTVGRAARFHTWHYIHRKIHEVEHENVGIESAHKTELAGEGVIRGGTRLIKHQIRTHRARQVRKWEQRDVKAKADLQFRTMARENPELKKKALARFQQKQHIKKQYQRQARRGLAARQGAVEAKTAALTTQKIAGAAAHFIKHNPKAIALAACLFLLVIILQSCVAALTSIGNGFMGAVGGTSFLAEDADIDKAELRYTEWEADLLLAALNAESSHPGYDEYNYYIDPTGHDPYALLALLTAVYDDFTFAQVEPVLRDIFAQQYSLTFTEIVEVRSYIDHWTDEDGSSHSETVYYNYYILNVTLTARPFTDVILPSMDDEQLERYDLYMITKGNRQYLANPFGDTNWLPYVTSYYGYRVHPISGEKNYHTGVDIGMPSGTDILAGQDGTVTFAGTNGGYGLVVVLDNGEGLVSKYAHCSTLLVSAGQEVKTGDVIAKVGNTGNSTGPHLHLEIIKDGRYLNPLYFAVTNDYGQ